MYPALDDGLSGFYVAFDFFLALRRFAWQGFALAFDLDLLGRDFRLKLLPFLGR